MTTTSATAVPAPAPDLYFDGQPADWTRLLAHVRIRFATHEQSFDTDSKRSGFLCSHFRGAALDWVAVYLAANTNALADFDGLVEAIQLTFGLDNSRERQMAIARLHGLRQSGDLLLFLAEFESLCITAGINADISKLALVQGKLEPYFANALATSCITYATWRALRTALVSVYASRPKVAGEPAAKKRKRATCGKCGKKGHTAGQCRSTN